MNDPTSIEEKRSSPILSSPVLPSPLHQDDLVSSPAHSSSSGGKFAIILLDGDTDVFDQLKGGNASGDRAARRVLELTREHFAGDTRLDTDYTILCYSFCNVWGLKNYLFENNLINVHEDFEEFRQGFNSVSASDALFNILDSGGVKQSADWLLAQHLVFWASNPTCGAILLGGTHDKGYVLPLRKLSSEALSKISILNTKNLCHQVYEEEFPSVKITNALAVVFQSAQRYIGRNAIKARVQLSRVERNDTGKRFKSVDSPCSEHYLKARCDLGPAYHYSHNYNWTEGELEAFPALAATWPCKFLRSPEGCADGDDCIYAHKCPFKEEECPHGVKCRYMKRGLPHSV